MTTRAARRSLCGLLAFGLIALASAAQGQTPHLTLRVLGTSQEFLTGRTESSEASPHVSLDSKGPWFGADLDFRLVPWVSLDLAVSQGSLDETRRTALPNDLLREGRTATLRHETVSFLFHPLSPERKLALYFGPTVGRAHFSRAFAPDEDEPALGGKIGFNVWLGALGTTRWLFAAELSDLGSDVQISPASSKGHLHSTVAAVGLGYSW